MSKVEVEAELNEAIISALAPEDAKALKPGNPVPASLRDGTLGTAKPQDQPDSWQGNIYTYHVH